MRRRWRCRVSGVVIAVSLFVALRTFVSPRPSPRLRLGDTRAWGGTSVADSIPPPVRLEGRPRDAGPGSWSAARVESVSQRQLVAPRKAREREKVSSMRVDPRREAIREAMVHAWEGYVRGALGHDEVRPCTNETNDSWGGMGITAADAIDTLALMGLSDQLSVAISVLRQSVGGDELPARNVSVFESTIRLGHTITKDSLLLVWAERLAEALLPAYESPTGIPWHRLDLSNGHAGGPGWSGGASILSEELFHLSRVTGRSVFWERGRALIDLMWEMEDERDGVRTARSDTPKWGHWGPAERGLWPVLVHPETGTFGSDLVSVGALGDSFYESLLKVWLLSGRSASYERFRRSYDAAVSGITSRMVGKTNRGSSYVGRWQGGSRVGQMDHLSCFFPGLLALGAEGSSGVEHFNLSRSLLDTCVSFYLTSECGLSPESVRVCGVGECDDFATMSPEYLLRPEVLESLFVLYRLTGEEALRDIAWEIFGAIEQHCRTPIAYSGVRDVRTSSPVQNDSMQSFFLAETLKYLWLIFSPPSTLPLSRYVFTTEAHPIPIIRADRNNTGMWVR